MNADKEDPTNLFAVAPAVRRVSLSLRSGADSAPIPVGQGFRAGVSLAAAGDMALSRRATSLHHAAFLARLGVPPLVPCALRQVHSKRVICIDATDGPGVTALVEADGMITENDDVLLTVTVADCLPGDPRGCRHGNFRAGALRVERDGDRGGGASSYAGAFRHARAGRACHDRARHRPLLLHGAPGKGGQLRCGVRRSIRGERGWSAAGPARGERSAPAARRRAGHHGGSRVHQLHVCAGLVPPTGSRGVHAHARVGGKEPVVSAPFTVRRMTPADKPAMLDISSRIWEGTDYIPGVFDEWVQDSEGEFAAVCIGDRLVGCGKLTFFTAERDAWIEGMRKDPRVTEKGMAAFLGRYFLDHLAGRAGLQSVRFSTYFSNLASITVNERLGFRLRTTFSLKAWNGTREEVERRAVAAVAAAKQRPTVVSDPSAVAAFLRRREAPGYDSLFVEGWRALPLSDEILARRYCDPGACRAMPLRRSHHGAVHRHLRSPVEPDHGAAGPPRCPGRRHARRPPCRHLRAGSRGHEGAACDCARDRVDDSSPSPLARVRRFPGPEELGARR